MEGDPGRDAAARAAAGIAVERIAGGGPLAQHAVGLKDAVAQRGFNQGMTLTWKPPAKGPGVIGLSSITGGGQARYGLVRLSSRTFCSSVDSSCTRSACSGATSLVSPGSLARS